MAEGVGGRDGGWEGRGQACTGSDHSDFELKRFTRRNVANTQARAGKQTKGCKLAAKRCVTGRGRSAGRGATPYAYARILLYRGELGKKINDFMMKLERVRHDIRWGYPNRQQETRGQSSRHDPRRPRSAGRRERGAAPAPPVAKTIIPTATHVTIMKTYPRTKER
ncbi:hypothetical protein EVAR_20875_1 [Eumeta japonica]|uniref:Uncharacterized protein n=1 Tax=Eumeta variegata TaxID=151549 RepID=A0A4C1UVG1_EUMVA|nr:hypothetical protein EVAR_20875_1 [Eumeta japonica]